MNQAVIEIYDTIVLPQAYITADYFQHRTIQIMNIITLKNCSITLILCTNQEIKSINVEYRNKDYATDVISFAYREESFPGENVEESELLGDIFLSIEKAQEQATQQEITLKQEIDRLLIHSILHLLGYDHEIGVDDEKKMFAEEDRLQTLLNGGI